MVTDYLIKKLEEQGFITKSQIKIAELMQKEQIEKAFEEGMFHYVNSLCPSEYYEELLNNRLTDEI